MACSANAIHHTDSHRDTDDSRKVVRQSAPKMLPPRAARKLLLLTAISLFLLPRIASAEEAAAPGLLCFFRGVSRMVAQDGEIVVRWQPIAGGTDEQRKYRYRLYLAPRSGDFDFNSKPAIETAPGAAEARLTALARGVTVFAVVRAVDAAGLEDGNDLEWAATPNPVRYVDSQTNAKDQDMDGLTPATAFRRIQAAIESAITMDGVNIYVAEGDYAEHLFIFDGMMLYGGFGRDFDSDSPASERRSRVIAPAGTHDLVTIAPGERFCGLDGFSLDGGGQAGRGILAEECSVRITNSSVRGFRRKGIELRSKQIEDSRAQGHVRAMTVENNGGEGLFLEGNVALEISDAHIAQNGGEGIEAKPLTVARDEKTQLVVERSSIRDNGDIGIDVDLASLPDGASHGGRYRVTLRDNIIAGNKDHGASIDVQFPRKDEIELYVRVLANSFAGNGKAGLHLDGDAIGKYEVAFNHIEAMGAHGAGLLTGDAYGAVFHLHHNVLDGDAGPALRQEGLGTLLFHMSDVAVSPGQEAITARAFVHATNISRALESRSPPQSAAGGAQRRATFGMVGPFCLPRAVTKEIELIEVLPAPDGFAGDGPWTLRFSESVAHLVRADLRDAGTGAPLATMLAARERVLKVQALDPIAAGTALSLMLSGPADTSTSGASTWRLVLPYTAAAPLPPPSGVIDQVPTGGTILLSASEPAVRFLLRPPRAGLFSLLVLEPDAGGGVLRIEARKGGKLLELSGNAFHAGPEDEIELLITRTDSAGGDEIQVRLLFDGPRA